MSSKKCKEPRFYGETTALRSSIMSKIRGKDTSIELKLRRSLWHKGIRYRKHYKIRSINRRSIDIAVTRYKIAIFCDSEFFHGKDWSQRKKRIASGNNAEYWVNKIEHNMQRDTDTDSILQKEGWIVLRFWQKDIENDLNGCVTSVEEAILERKLDNGTRF